MMPDYNAMPEDLAYDSWKDQQMEQEITKQADEIVETVNALTDWVFGAPKAEPDELRIERRVREENPEMDEDMQAEAMEAIYEAMDAGAAF